jgi:hypothetical protein
MKTLAFIVAVLLVCAAHAERPPQSRDKADLIVVGKVTKLTAEDEKFGGDGVKTTYIATVKVDKVEKGEAGDKVAVTWFRVTTRPSNPLPGAYGQDHKLKQDDVAKFWLMKDGKGGWDVIYNTNGVEKVKK